MGLPVGSYIDQGEALIMAQVVTTMSNKQKTYFMLRVALQNSPTTLMRLVY